MDRRRPGSANCDADIGISFHCADCDGEPELSIAEHANAFTTIGWSMPSYFGRTEPTAHRNDDDITAPRE
jgi:hypothetical protein